MGGSSTVIVALILLFAGMMAAVVQLKSRSRDIEKNNIVPLPQIGGMSLRRGPWPGCLGKEGLECVELIEKYAPDVTVEIITPDMLDSMSHDFDVKRVRVFVDDDGLVMKLPVRGH